MLNKGKFSRLLNEKNVAHNLCYIFSFFKKCRKVILQTKIDHNLDALLNSGKMILKKYILLSVASIFLCTLRELTAKVQLLFLNVGKDQGIILNIK